MRRMHPIMLVLAGAVFGLAACAQQPAPRLEIYNPLDGAVIVYSRGVPLTIQVRTTNDTRMPRTAANIWLQVFDNSNTVVDRAVVPNAAVGYPVYGDPIEWYPRTLGDHVLQARARYTYDNETHQTPWSVVHVCVVSDPDRVVPIPWSGTNFCNVTLAPTPQNLVIASPTPHLTIAPPQDNSGRSDPGGNGTGGSASGCEQYTNQSSCNLAGCSWNPQASTCSVNP